MAKSDKVQKVDKIHKKKGGNVEAKVETKVEAKVDKKVKDDTKKKDKKVTPLVQVPVSSKEILAKAAVSISLFSRIWVLIIS